MAERSGLVRLPQRTVLIAAVAACFAVQGALANPVGPAVVSGQATFSATGRTLTVTNTPNAIINWQGFSIGASEATRFQQQTAASAVMNRVVGQDPSAILGALWSNGRVFLLNPNGIVFGAGSRVDVAGLVASTLNITDADFLAGRLNFQSGAVANSVVNQGSIATPSGGQVYLIAPNVENHGIITTPQGETLLAAGKSVKLVEADVPNLRVEIQSGGEVLNVGQILASGGKAGIYAGLIDQRGIVRADTPVLGSDGKIVFRASSNITLAAGSATSASGAKGGSVDISAPVVIQAGELHADGATGGSINVQAGNLLQAGAVTADGSAGAGGTVSISAGSIIQTSSTLLSANGNGGAGGTVTVAAGQAAGDGIFSSATFSATGTTGGRIAVTGSDIELRGAKLDTSGDAGGGTVLVGGDWQGRNPDVATAQRTQVNFSTTISADARQSGDGGKVVVWSDLDTQFFGNISARGGALSGDGGHIEVSGKENLVFGGLANAGSPHGVAGTLLLDPKNIVIDAAGGGGTGPTALVDPHIGANDQFGNSLVLLSNGNIVVPDSNDSFVASGAGAVYLFNGGTGALISALTGSTAGDAIGSNGIAQVGSGNFVVISPNWNNGPATQAGAVTWGSKTSGVSGAVGPSNSLVGSTANDQVGNNGVTPLPNGNYLVLSGNWNNGPATLAGAVTFGSGNSGVSGVLSASNSLVGANAGDQVGSGNGVMLLNNSGNYLVVSPNGGMGAVTWGDGGIGVSGIVSSSNSLVGSVSNDQVGSGGVTVLGNRNYLVLSPNWNDGATTQAGAVTFGNASTGVSGVVSASNSLVGSTAGDQVGSSGVFELFNSNYLVLSPNWNNGPATQAGAVTFGSGNSGVSGVLSASNSLVGANAGDQVGSGNGVMLLNNSGNYLVVSPNGGMGAVTWGDGGIGVSGVVSSSNSLVGSVSNDQVGNGGVTVLGNGNYLVLSPNWNDGATTQAGAVTFGNGSTGVSGVVSSSNSLVGANSFDQVGSSGVMLLNSGNYLVVSPHGGLGAVTWGDGGSGVSGVVGSANSLVGSTSGDQVGGGGVTQLFNGNYVVNSPNWSDGAVTQVGAVTWGSGTSGVAGVVSSSNSLVGANAFDQVGNNGVIQFNSGYYLVVSQNGGLGAVTWGDSGNGVSGVVGPSNSLVGSTSSDQVGSGGVTPLFNGNYVVISPSWNDGAATQVGAVTFGDGSIGVSGVVSSSNSLVGSTPGDHVGSGGVAQLFNGNYVVQSPNWNNGAATQAGAATFGNGGTGVAGVVSSANSLVGTTTNDQVGSNGVFQLGTANYLVLSPNWSNGGAAQAGAVTFGDSTSGVSGAVSASNSLVGSTTGDRVGSNGVFELSVNANYLVLSPNWNNGAATQAGAVTFGGGSSGVSGVVSAANSLVGSTTNDAVGNFGILEIGSGKYLVRSQNWNNGAATHAGAVTMGSIATGGVGTVSAANSLVGSTANDQVGNGGVTVLASGNFVLSSPNWHSGAATNAGAMTWASITGSTVGVVSAANSLVGSTTNDGVGSGGLTQLPSGNYLVNSPFWHNGAASNVGAVTWGSGTSGVSGVVSATNSLVGSTTNDQLGSGGVNALSNGNYMVISPNWDNGAATNAGAVTWGNGTSGTLGSVSAANSLVGTTANDFVGDTGVLLMSNGKYVVRSLNWNNGAATGAGAVTVGSTTTGISGAVSSANSLVGFTTNDHVGSGGTFEFSSGRLLVISPQYDNGAVDSGRVQIYTGGGSGPSIPFANPLLFANAPAGNATITPGQITAITNTGTAVTMQANNDITLAASSDIITSAGGSGGGLTMQAGRSIALNSNITTDNGNLTLMANETAANGVIAANRDSGVATLTMAPGTVINAGTGDVRITLGAGTGQSGASASGDITLSRVTGRDMYVLHDGLGAGGSIRMADAASVITARSIILELENPSGAGSVGASSLPIMVTPNPAFGTNINVESHSHMGTGGIFIDSTGDMTIGGAVLFGGLAKGVQALAGGQVELTATGTLSTQAGSAGCGLTGGTGGPICARVPTVSGDSITLKAADMDLQNVVTAWDVALKPVLNQPFDLGSTGSGGGTINLSQAELNRASGAFFLALGDAASSGSISLSAAINWPTLGNLSTGGAINGGGNTLSATGANLDLRSGAGITLNTNLNTLSAYNTTSGSIAITDSGAGTLTLDGGSAPASRSMQNDAAGGGISVSSSKNLTVQTGMQASGAIALASGGTGDLLFQNDSVAFSNATSVTLTAGHDIALRGTLTAASGGLAVNLNAGNMISTPAGANLVLDGATAGLTANVNNSKTWNNNGTITLQGSSTIRIPNPGGGFATFSNNPGATLNINSTAGWSFTSDPSLDGGIFNNAGTVNVGHGTSWEAAFTNTGALNIAGGQFVSMQNGHTIAGAIDIGAGGLLWVSERHGTNALFNGTSITGSGTLRVTAGIGPVADFAGVTAGGATLEVGSGGTANILAGTSSFGRLDMLGGSVTVSGTANVGTVNLQSGSLAGAGNLTASADFIKTGGSFSVTGNLDLTRASGNFSPPGPLSANSVRLNAPAGTLSVNQAISAGVVDLDGSVVDLLPSGAVNATSLARIAGETVQSTSGIATISAPSTVINAGLLHIEPAGSSPAGISVTGDLAVSAGSVRLKGSDSSSGASAKLTVGGKLTMTVGGGGLTLQGGNAAGAFASIDPAKMMIDSAGDVKLLGGAGADAHALIYNPDGDITINVPGAASIFLTRGSGADANAAIVAAAGFVTLTAFDCNGCSVLFTNPVLTDPLLGSHLLDTGVFGSNGVQINVHHGLPDILLQSLNNAYSALLTLEANLTRTNGDGQFDDEKKLPRCVD